MENTFINNSSKKWFLITGIVFLAFTVIGYFLIGSSYFELFLFGAIGLSIATLLFLIDKQSSRIEEKINDAIIEIQAASEITKITNTKLPLNLGGWAITAHFLSRLVKEIYLRKPNVIVECGSGTSTLVTASCLKDLGEGKLFSLDHLEEYAQQTRVELEFEGLKDWAEVITAPLREYDLDIKVFKWYGFDFHKYLGGNKIDMLIIDGPPGPIQPLSRYPAIPLLKEFLAEEYLILIDDGNRDDETRIAHKWATMLDADLKLNNNGRGFWILENKER